MDSRDTWYFAYGSNLDAERKQARTGKIREARRCRAPGYRLAFNKRGSDGSVKANIIALPDSETWGVVYKCSPEALEQMDEWEGVRDGHYVRHPIEVVTDAGQTVRAMTYIAGAHFVTAEGKPGRVYLKHILEGARSHNLPAAYIRSIEALGTSGGTR